MGEPDVDVRTLAFLCNPNARSGLDAAALAEHGVPRARCVDVEDPGALPEVVADAVARGRRWFVAVGGDGSLGPVAEAVAATPGADGLGVLPAGTGNDFARALGMPLDIGGALAALRRTTAGPLDLLRVHVDGRTHTGVNASTLGEPAATSDALDDELKATWGPLAYLAAGVDALQQLRTRTVTVQVDDRDAETLELLGAIFANGRSVAGGVPVAPRADWSDGRLEVGWIVETDPAALPSLAAALVAGRLADHPGVRWEQARRVVLEGDMPANLDGDRLPGGRRTWTLDAGATRVLRPA